MNSKHFVLSLGLTMLLGTGCAAKAWRGIVPLKSTRADTERLLGPAHETIGESVIYQLPDEVVSIWFSVNPGCSEKLSAGSWNVVPGTVTSIDLRLKKGVPLASLGLDLTKFKKAQGDADVPGNFEYVTDEEGFSIEVYDAEDGLGEMVWGYSYMPRAADRHLYCAPSRGTGPTSAGGRCPFFRIEGPSGLNPAGGTVLNLSAGIDFNGPPVAQPGYKWTVSAGRITSGQGSNQITVETAGLGAQTITVTLEIINLPSNCPRAASWKVQLGSGARKGRPTPQGVGCRHNRT